MQYTSNQVNTEALASDLYNPPADPKALMLQQLMESTAYVAASPIGTSTDGQRAVAPLYTADEVADPTVVAPELREHVETFLAMSKSNPYQGVIVNPTKCLIDPIHDDFQSTIDYMNGRFSDNGTWTTAVPEILAAQAEVTADLDTVEEHTDRLTNNLPSLAGLAQGALALATVMSLLSNPCLGLDGLLGSIMDSGKALLNQAKNQINSMLNQVKSTISDLVGQAQDAINAALGPLVQDIKDAISVAKAQITAFIAKAKAEVMAFAKAMLAQIRQGLAELLANLPKDPCLKSLLGSVVTGAAAAAIGG